ncbi:MAG: hypothetical protein IH818_11405 [Acidobacteria bacterium]|nr:hypothetical protein [Acidobacteriota bacterium]
MVGRRRGPGPAGRGGRRRRRRRQRRRRVILVGGMVAIGTKKMSAKNAQSIEEHTGVPPEELEDADLEEAMKELGIPDEEVSEGDVEESS